MPGRKVLAASLLTLLVAPSWGVSQPPVHHVFRQDGDRYYFDGGFAVDASPRLVWEVLTDYDNIARIVPNMKGRVLRKEAGETWVDQSVGGGFLFIHVELKGTLRIVEKPFEYISLEEVSRKNFGLYQGVWSLSPHPCGVGALVSYSLVAERNPETPGFLTPELFGNALRDLLKDMKREMERRHEKEVVQTHGSLAGEIYPAPERGKPWSEALRPVRTPVP